MIGRLEQLEVEWDNG